MWGKGVIGLVCFQLCCSPLLAQQEAGERAAPEAQAAVATVDPFETGSASSRNSVGFLSPPWNERVCTAGNESIGSSASPSLVSDSVESVDSSGVPYAQLYAAKLVNTPSSDLSTQPLISRAMVKEAFTREHVAKMAHDFVLGQPLPDAPSYVPLTSKQKFDAWARHTYSADMFLGTMFDSLILQATGAWPEYGGGMGGFGKRYGTQLISAESWSLFGRWLFPTLLHQDPRYFPSGRKNAFDRMAYAASRAIITRSDDGRSVFNSSLFLTLLFSSALSNGYKPLHNKSFPATMENAAAGLGAVAQVNLLNEFWPDLKKLFLRHEPGKVRDLRRSTTDKWDDFTADVSNKQR